VPHYLPGQNAYLTEWLKDSSWIPADAARGGVETTYPEYRLKIATKPAAPASAAPRSADRLMPGLFPHDGKVHVLPVQGNVYMLIVDGYNIAASIGADGVMLVDTGPAHMTDGVLETVRQLATAVSASPAPNRCTGMRCPGVSTGWSSPYIHAIISSPAPAKPLRYIVNTSASPDRAGGNEKLAPTGFFYRGGGGAAGNFAGGIDDDGAAVIAHENVLLRLSGAAPDEPAKPQAAWPTDTYWRGQFKLHQHFNSEPVFLYHTPAAHSDGDSMAFFRSSDVISAGNLFWTTSYPLIDVKRGGTIQGVIDGLNHILDLGSAENMSQGGTWIIPGRGRLSDIADVASYRNMLAMIRDRIQDMIRRGMTLDQVKAARPTMDFDGRYGSDTGSWTTDMFLEAVYKSLSQGSTTQ
jgi:glyoxylase-like metal-dependent hydrolase (beta-lactamase superfamily II)